jgi:hypothetical protein
VRYTNVIKVRRTHSGKKLPVVGADIAVDEATMVLKLIDTPLLWNISFWIIKSISLSCNYLEQVSVSCDVPSIYER